MTISGSAQSNAEATGSAGCAGARGWIPLVTAIVAFVIYAALACITYPAQDHSYGPERSSLAAAASTVSYGARLGRVYLSVLERFLEVRSSTEQVLAEAARREIPQRDLQATTRDGNGIGYMLVAKFAFQLFGLHIGSIVAAMLLLMAASAAAFLYRFRDRRCAVVILYFTALCVMLFTPLVTVPSYIANLPVGGIRYFSLLAILPAFHLLLEIADPRAPATHARWLAPAAVQVIVLLIAILVRNSGATVIGAIGAALLLCLWRVRRDRPAASALLRKTGRMAVIGAVFVVLLAATFPSGYLKEGRFTETVWHRIFVSLGLHPNFPFYGGIREMFDCSKHIPEGILAGTEDRNGHCVWLVYADKHGISMFRAPFGTYGRQYDAALREAFFDILRAYPADVLKTFTLIKTKYIAWSLQETLKFDLAAFPRPAIWLLVAALANLLVFAFFRPWPVGSSGTIGLAGATGLFAAFCLLPYYAVWAMPYTIGELLVYCFLLPGLALFAAIGRLLQALAPAPPAIGHGTNGAELPRG